jgi:TatD DNase family protein
MKDDKLFGIFHCFSGDLEQAKKAISYKMKLGIGGVVTFKNGKIDKFLNEIPIENIVLETDSPYLAPTPFRGKRNESSYITKVLDKLVDIYQLTPQEIADITTQNSRDIFGI